MTDLPIPRYGIDYGDKLSAEVQKIAGDIATEAKKRQPLQRAALEREITEALKRMGAK